MYGENDESARREGVFLLILGFLILIALGAAGLFADRSNARFNERVTECIAAAMIEGGVFSDDTPFDELVDADGSPRPEYVEAVRVAIETRRGEYRPASGRGTLLTV